MVWFRVLWLYLGGHLGQLKSYWKPFHPFGPTSQGRRRQLWIMLLYNVICVTKLFAIVQIPPTKTLRRCRCRFNNPASTSIKFTPLQLRLCSSSRDLLRMKRTTFLRVCDFLIWCFCCVNCVFPPGHGLSMQLQLQRLQFASVITISLASSACSRLQSTITQL